MAEDVCLKSCYSQFMRSYLGFKPFFNGGSGRAHALMRLARPSKGCGVRVLHLHPLIAICPDTMQFEVWYLFFERPKPPKEDIFALRSANFCRQTSLHSMRLDRTHVSPVLHNTHACFCLLLVLPAVSLALTIPRIAPPTAPAAPCPVHAPRYLCRPSGTRRRCQHRTNASSAASRRCPAIMSFAQSFARNYSAISSAVFLTACSYGFLYQA